LALYCRRPRVWIHVLTIHEMNAAAPTNQMIRSGASSNDAINRG
jgi:hypothetical protein